MKKFPLLAGALAMVVTFSSCIKDNCTQMMTYVKYDPIYKQLDEIRQPIEIQSSRSLKNPGKIYLYNDYILINEHQEGIHVIDNSDPRAPQNVAFIAITGNIDMAIKDNVLYADNYIDLLALDFTNPAQAKLLNRVENVFPFYGEDPEQGLLVGYHGEEVTEEVECQQAGWNNTWGGPVAEMDATFTTTAGGGGATGATAGNRAVISGVGGSMARFTIHDEYLYTVDEQDLNVFDISTLDNPAKINQINVGWGIETIFPAGENLFIGSNNGMFIYDNSVPNSPTFLSRFDHPTACDPVYVDGDYAYVTLRTGTACEGFQNQLDVVDISTLTNPFLVRSYEMTNPHGLGIKDDALYLCDGSDGLKVFDITDVNSISQNMLFHDNSLNTYDVIPNPGKDAILVVGDDGFFQYDNSDKSDLKLISSIPVEK